MIIYANNEFEWGYVEANQYINDSTINKNKAVDLVDKVSTFYSNLVGKFILNEIKHIKSARVQSKDIVVLADDGAMNKRKIYYVQTDGINYEEVILINIVDPIRTDTNNTRTTFANDGLYPAMNKVYAEYRRITKGFIDFLPENFAPIVTSIFEMGFVCPVTKGGHSIREENDITVRAAKHNPIESWKPGCMNNTKHALRSVFSNAYNGQFPNAIGTEYIRVMMNLPKHQKMLEDVQDEDDMF
jgi:hypothetical protein